jgi:DNA helicase-2/ATP-dependent DNA helicase PcrA
MSFQRDWPEARVLYLETNYRSTGSIVAAAGEFIRQNTHRHPKRMATPNPMGKPVVRRWLPRRWSQYAALAEQAAAGERFTVLYRNHESALPLIDLLEKQGTPYVCRGGKAAFFTHPTVRDVMDILLFAKQPDDTELFQRLYYKFRCGMTRELAEQTVKKGKNLPGRPLFALAAALCQEDWLQSRLESLYAQLCLLNGETSAQALSRIYDQMGYREYLRGKNADEGKLEILMALARNNPQPEVFLQRLSQLEVLAAEGKSQQNAAVVLSTIHGSKGLEYKRVILLDVVDGVLPQSTAAATEEEEVQLEEERRLFYVGLTRAKEQLEILCCRDVTSSFALQLFPEERPREYRPAPKPAPKVLPKADPELFSVGVMVRHKQFGRGLICSRSGDIVLIRFDDGQQKRIALHTALRAGILKLDT